MKLPVPETRELSVGESWNAMVEHFGMDDIEITRPIPLDELPILRDKKHKLVPTERHEAYRIWGTKRGNT